MRRISLALALLGAVAAAGCGGAGNSGSSSSSGRKGVAQGNFTVTVQNGQAIGGIANPSLAITGGYVTSVPAGIDCGVAPHAACSFNFPLNTPVTLTATAVGNDGALPFQFLGWAGACQGETPCQLTGNADKYIVTMFGGARSGHAPWVDGDIHSDKYALYGADPASSLQCSKCHGATLLGSGRSPSCASCHVWPIAPVNPTGVGLAVAVTSASLDASNVLTINFTVQDAAGNPIALPTGGRFALARVDTDATSGAVLPYTVLTPAAATGNPSTIS